MLQRVVCSISVGASWLFNVIAGKEGEESLAVCLCVRVCIHLKEKKIGQEYQ